MAKSDSFSQFYVEKFPIAFARDSFQKQLKKLKLLKDIEHWIFKIAVNLKENISCVPKACNFSQFPKISIIFPI